MSKGHTKRPRWLVWLVRTIAALASLMLVVTLALGFGLQTRVARELIHVRANRALEGLFRGRVSVERIGELGWGGAVNIEARVLDAEGREVIRAHGLRARVSIPSLVWQLVLGKPRQLVRIPIVSADTVEVTLYQDAAGEVSLGSSFEPATPVEPASPEEAASTIDVELPDIQLHQVRVRGALGGQPIDAELSDLVVQLEYVSNTLRLVVNDVELTARGLPYALEPRVSLEGELVVPSGQDDPIRVNASLHGTVLGSSLQAEVGLRGRQLSGQLSAWDIAPEVLNQRIDGLRLRSPSALSLAVEGELSALHIEAVCENDAFQVSVDGALALPPSLEARLVATLTRVDLSGVIAAPVSDVSAVVQVQAMQSGDAPLYLVHTVRVLPSVIAGQPIPETIVDGLVVVDNTVTTLDGQVRVNEPGADLTATYEAHFPTQGVSAAQAQLDLRLSDPPRLRAVRGVQVSGSAHVTAAWNSDDAISADVKVGFERVGYQRFEVQGFRLNGRVGGTTESPQAQASVEFHAAGGGVTGALDVAARKQTFTLRAKDLDARELSSWAELPKHAERGKLDVALSARRTDEKIDAALEVSARGLSIAGLHDASIETRGTLDGGKVNVDASAHLGRLGHVELAMRNFVVPQMSSPLELATLQGELTTDADIDLTQVSTLLAATTLPVEKLGGRLKLRAEVSRTHGQVRPRVRIDVRTQGLALAEKREAHPPSTVTASAVREAPFALQDVDMSAQLGTGPEAENVALDVEILNRRATLALIQLKAALPANWRMLLQPSALLALPLDGSLVVPKQELQQLPVLIRPDDFTGGVTLEASLQGSVLRPNLEVTASVENLQADPQVQSLDVNLKADYTPRGGKVHVEAGGGRASAQVYADWQGDLKRIGEMNERYSPVQGNVSAHWTDFPCALIPALVERQLGGEVSGDVDLKQWGQDAALRVKLASRSLAVDKLPIRALDVRGEITARRLKSQAIVELEGGTFKATFDTSAEWGKRSVPTFEPNAQAHLQARNFQVSSLSPLIGRAVSEMAGVLDAEAHLSLTPERTEWTGTADIQQGVLQVPALGQRFSNINGHVEIRGDQIQLRELTASGTTGKLRVDARGELRGFDLARVEANLKIGRDDKIPVTLQGVAIGDAWGNVHAEYVDNGKQPQLEVDVRQFTISTPESGGYGLQDLEAASDVRVGVQRTDGKFVLLPVQPLEPEGAAEEDVARAGPSEKPLRVRVLLGDVTVERGTTATAQLSGELQIVTEEPTSVTGRIEVRGGQLDVQGKRFEIERGVVTFDGVDPANPTITATARWDSPTDHAVYAEYVGDVKTGKIKLHSEPPLTQDEIASLLLFGTVDGTMGSGESSEATMAVSVAGGTVAQGLNHALSSLTNLDLSARVDTSSGSPRPELVFQVTPRVSAKVSRAVGEPNAGEAPDRTFLTLELRLQRAWALSAVFGDRGGSALDLIWRYRY